MENSKELTIKKDENLEKAFKRNVDTMIANREYFKSQLESIMEEGKDYYVIKGKKSLSKGGAEKLASGFKLHAKFKIDEDAKKAFENVPGLIAYRCELYNSKNAFVGEGGGADTLGRNQNDPNKTIKMAQKRAYTDAVIRTTGLSDIFTQDLEDMPRDRIAPEAQNWARTKESPRVYTNNPDGLITPKQVDFIRRLLKDVGETELALMKNPKLVQYGMMLDKIPFVTASNIIEYLLKKKNAKKTKPEDMPTIDAETGEVIEDMEEGIILDPVEIK